MQSQRHLGILILAGGLLVPALAADADAPSIAIVTFMEPRPGMENAFEKGRKKHNAWHVKAKDPWGWQTWEVLSGPRTGQYLVGSFGHRWIDFDERVAHRQTGDSTDAAKHVSPFVARYETQYYRYLPEISLAPDTTPPAPLARVVVAKIREKNERALFDALRRVREAAKAGKRGAPCTFYSLVSGGETPTLIQIFPVASWAQMDLPAPEFGDYLEPLVGTEAARSIMETIADAVEREERYVLKYLPDLSYDGYKPSPP